MGSETGGHVATEPAPWRIDLRVPSRVSLGDHVSPNPAGCRVLPMEGMGVVLGCPAGVREEDRRTQMSCQVSP